MENRTRSIRQEQARLSKRLRGAGCSWRQVADEFVSRWGLTYLQAFRLAHGWSQEQAANHYNGKWRPERPLTGKNISYWEMWPSKSGKEPPLSKLGRLAGVYDCTVSDLLADVGQDRRELPGDSNLLALEAAGSSDAALQLNGDLVDPTAVIDDQPEDVIDVLGRIQRLKAGTVDPDIIRHLDSNLRHTIADYERLDHSVLAPALVKQRAWIDTLLLECGYPKQRQQLFQVAGATSGLLGYVAVGRGEFPLARAYCLEAFQLAGAADAHNFQAWVRGLQSFCEYYAGRYGEALSLARDGLKYAQGGPQSVRLTINGVARALGKLGDVQGVHRAVADAYEFMSGNHVPDGVPSSISLGCYSAAQTASNAATAYLSLGLPDKVQQYIDLALPDISASESRWSRSLVLIDLASSQIRGKSADLDHAADLVLDALEISAGRPIVSLRQRTREFISVAAERYGNHRQIDQVRDAASALSAR